MSMYWYTQYTSIHVLYRVQRCTMVYLKKTQTKLSIYNQIPQNKYKLEVIFFNKNFKHESSLKLILYYFRGTMVWERNSTPRIHQTLDCLLIVNDSCLQATDTIYTCALSGTCITGHYYGYFKPFQLKHPPIHTKTCAPPQYFQSPSVHIKCRYQFTILHFNYEYYAFNVDNRLEKMFMVPDTDTNWTVKWKISRVIS